MEVYEAVPFWVSGKLPSHLLFVLDFCTTPNTYVGYLPSLVPWILGFRVRNPHTFRGQCSLVRLFLQFIRLGIELLMAYFEISYVTQYSFILLAQIMIYSSSCILYIYGSLRASRRISTLLLDSVLGSTLR